MDTISTAGSKLTHGNSGPAGRRAPWATIAGAAPVTVAERLLLTLVGFPRRSVAPEILTAARRRARRQRAKMLYRVMRGLTGILVRLTLYGLAYRLVCAVRGGPFRRGRAVAGSILREPVGYRPSAATAPDSRPGQDDWMVDLSGHGPREFGPLGRGRVTESRLKPS